jgi:hypothetical protein
VFAFQFLPLLVFSLGFIMFGLIGGVLISRYMDYILIHLSNPVIIGLVVLVVGALVLL